jgi:hypothetical protein
MKNLRFKKVMRYSPDEKQFRFFRLMWENYRSGETISNKLAFSIKNWLPRVTLRKSYGGLYV